MSATERVTAALGPLAGMVVVADDEQRENEGDLSCVAQRRAQAGRTQPGAPAARLLATAQTPAFIVRPGTGRAFVALSPTGSSCR